MDYAIGSGGDLRIVSEETAQREADAGVEGGVTDWHLHWKGLPSISRLADEILHLGIERVVAIVIPTHIYRAIGFSCGPRKKWSDQSLNGSLLTR